MNANIALSKLVPGKVNPRKVKPDRDAHRRMVASIKAFDLIQPLVVRPLNGRGQYQVTVGSRRLAALKDIYRHSKADPKIPCVVRQADERTAKATALAENFVREGMHPLDEADAFAELAGEEGKDAKAIAVQFGESEHYVRQRMKLSALAEPVKAAYREGQIDTGTAEVFTSVPEDRQLVIWKELNGHPRHAEQVRNIINASWIDASYALFDVSTLPPSVVSRDLFSERVLVERAAFLQAQAAAVAKEREGLIEEGWKEVVMGPQAEVQDRLYSTAEAEPQVDQVTQRKLHELGKQWKKLEAKLGDVPEDDEAKQVELREKMEAIETETNQIWADAPKSYSEAVKAKGIVFLMLDAEGRLHRAYRLPKRQANAKNNGEGSAEGSPDASTETLPTSDDLSDRQLATTFTHQAIAVREAVYKNRLVRKRVLVLILHDRVRSEALSIDHDANGTTVHADNSEGFASPSLAFLRKRRAEIDPFIKNPPHKDMEAYKRLCKLKEPQLDALIELLTVECLTAHMQRRTELVQHLASELKVNIREFWNPDAAWLGSYQKVQLSHLMVELCGVVHKPSEDRKKTDLVLALEKLFADAAGGKLEDKKLAETVNGWLPSNLRPVPKNG